MEANTHQSRKISFFQKESILFKVKFAWKILVVLVLSVLLFAPAPTLALDNHNDLINSYLSNTENQLNSILISIKKLPNLSYENGQNTLKVIDKNLEVIRTNAEENSKKFKNLSDEAQKEYQNNLDLLNKNEELLKAKNKLELDFIYGRDYIFRDTTDLKYENQYYYVLNNRNYNTDGLSLKLAGIIYEGAKRSCITSAKTNLEEALWFKEKYGDISPLASICIRFYLNSKYKWQLDGLARPVYLIPGDEVGEGFTRVLELFKIRNILTNYNAMVTLYKEVKEYCDAQGVTITNDKFPDCIPKHFENKYPIKGSNIIIRGNSFQFETRPTYNVMRAYHAVKRFDQLEQINKNLAEGIVLTDKLSKLLDNLARRIKLAEEKSANVKNYADVLESFCEPEIVSEIGELEKFVTELTNKLALAS
ncbi:MAG: hypothetical protein U7127_21210 [Phormidium sp.]